MAQGGLRGTLTVSLNSITNPTSPVGSVAVSVGDLVFVTIGQQTNLTAGACTDNLGNTYAALNAGTDAGNCSIRCYYSRVTVAGTLTQVDIAATASTNDVSAIADVIEGPFKVSPLDANPANNIDTLTPYPCPVTGVLAQANEVVMTAIVFGGNQTMPVDAPFSICGTVTRNSCSTAQARLVTAATTSVAPQFGGTSGTTGSVTASFKLEDIVAVPRSFGTIIG